MTDRLSINGWMVAEANLEEGYAPHETVHRVFVFRHPDGWTTLTIRRDERYADNYSDRPTGGTATVTPSNFATLADLADYIDKAYRAGAWTELLDAGHGGLRP